MRGWERDAREDSAERPGGGSADRFGGGRKGGGLGRRVCRFCGNHAMTINYKDQKLLRVFVSERGKIVPRRISGNCARHQRRMTRAIKQARNLSLLPFTTIGL